MDQFLVARKVFWKVSHQSSGLLINEMSRNTTLWPAMSWTSIKYSSVMLLLSVEKKMYAARLW